MTLLRLSLALLLFLTCASGQAEIYKYKDKDGHTVYSDSPPASENTPSEKIEISQPNSAAPPDPSLKFSDEVRESKEEERPDQSVKITSPVNDTTVVNGSGTFHIAASVEPRTYKGQHLQLKVNGNPEGKPQTSKSWTFTNTNRGSYSFVVQLIDESGTVITNSPIVTVHVKRPSVNLPGRKNFGG